MNKSVESTNELITSIEVNSAELKEALAFVKPTLGNSKVIPATGYFYFNVNQDRLRIHTYDQVNSLACEVALYSPTLTEDYSILVDPMLFELLSRIVPTVISIEFFEKSIQGNSSVIVRKIRVRAGDGHYDFEAEDPIEFPKVITEPGVDFTIKASILGEIIDGIEYAADPDPDQDVLHSLCIRILNNKVNFIATDKVVLHRIIRDDVVADPGEYLINMKALKHLRTICSKVEPLQELTLVFSKRTVRLASEDYFLVARLIDRKYPDYNDLLKATNHNFSIDMDRKYVLNCLYRLDVFRKLKVELLFSEGQLIMSLDAGFDEIYERVGKSFLTYQGEENFRLGTSIKKLIEILKHIRSDRVQIKMKDPATPFLISPAGELEKHQEEVVLLCTMN